MAAPTWLERMPAVFDLILCKTDKIVDDTSLEKLLELMEFINKDLGVRPFLLRETTLQFLTEVQRSSSPSAVAFGLRLAGIISSSEEGFQTLTNYDILSSSGLFYGLFQDKKQLWTDAVVRDSYFKSITRTIGINRGLQWAQKAGCIQQAIECLVDSSIFVADGARKLVANYIVSLYNNVKESSHLIAVNVKQCDERQQHCHRESNNTEYLQNKDLICITCIASYIRCLIKMPPCGLDRTMTNQVSCVQLLLSLMETHPLVGQDVLRQHDLLYPCFQLLHFANKNDCMKVVDVLITFTNNTRKWNIDWRVLLNAGNHCVFNVLLEYALILFQRSFISLTLQFTQGLFAVQCTSELQDSWLCSLFTIITFPVYGSLYQMNGHEEGDHFDPKKAANHMLSGTSSREESYKTFNMVVKDLVKTYLSPSALSNSVLVATEVMELLTELKESQLPHLELFISSWCCDILTLLSNQADEIGDHLIRQCIKALTVAIQHGFLTNQGNDAASNEMKTFRLLLKFSNERSDSQIVTGCLDCMKSLFGCASNTLLSSYINENMDKINLGILIRRHFSHPCWDVRDSVLGFLSHIISTLDNNKSVLFLDLLRHHRLLELVWFSKDDIECYVRTSVIQLIGVISINAHIWKEFCHVVCLSEKLVLNSILDSFLQDEAAFPRRAIIELLSFWIDTSHNITSLILNSADDKRRCLDSHVARVLDKASQDFDWEVKLCALDFWERLLKLCEDDELIAEFCQVICAALLDCGQPVKRKGLELLKRFQSTLNKTGSQNESFESFGELEDYIMRQHNQTNCARTENVLATIDVSRVVDKLDDPILSDPLPFLEDLLLAATDSENNLLDCY